MLKSLKGSLGRRFSKVGKHHQDEKLPRPSFGGNDLVLQTKEVGLNGVVDEDGCSKGMAITGCGSAWTKSFNLSTNVASRKLSAIAQPPVLRKESSDSLFLDESLFDGDETDDVDNVEEKRQKKSAESILAAKVTDSCSTNRCTLEPLHEQDAEEEEEEGCDEDVLDDDEDVLECVEDDDEEDDVYNLDGGDSSTMTLRID
eukprot:m.98476 g.98476  ORF g.98476 m.98476 type:complete len:201 (+) comp9014_c6_seq1:271-873(+)